MSLDLVSPAMHSFWDLLSEHSFYWRVLFVIVGLTVFAMVLGFALAIVNLVVEDGFGPILVRLRWRRTRRQARKELAAIVARELDEQRRKRQAYDAIVRRPS